MAPLTLIGIAIGLAMDAFAVSLGIGLKLCVVDRRQTFRLSFHFGLFQALMPVLGWLVGLTFASLIEAFDHWIAFGLLGAIGGKMLYEAFRAEEGVTGVVNDPTRGLSLIVLSVATSIDALAVGLSLALLRVDIWYPALVIGLVAAALTFVGLRLGCRFGSLLGRRMEAVGGVILILIGFRILFEHLSG
jgi:manganese efflux pump family protein